MSSPAMPKSPLRDALALEGIAKSFGATHAIERVSLAVRKGEALALMGANGAGKSTLAKIASGALQPDAGQILLDGRAVRFLSPRSARENGVVTVHQATDQLGVVGISVGENLVLDGICGGTFPMIAGPALVKRRARDIAAQIGLEIPLDQDFGALTPAQRQLVAIARAVAAQASVLILDEPTACLGGAEAERLLRANRP